MDGNANEKHRDSVGDKGDGEIETRDRGTCAATPLATTASQLLSIHL